MRSLNQYRRRSFGAVARAKSGYQQLLFLSLLFLSFYSALLSSGVKAQEDQNASNKWTIEAPSVSKPAFSRRRAFRKSAALSDRRAFRKHCATGG